MSGLWMYLNKYIPPDSTILSLGCGVMQELGLSPYTEDAGKGSISLQYKKLKGVDIWEPYIKILNEHGIDAMVGDVNEAGSLFEPKSYDVVMCCDIIEHLKKEDGYKLIENAERIASKATIFYTPTKWFDNRTSVEDKKFYSYGNPYHHHLSYWSADDFRSAGYGVDLSYANGEGIIAWKNLK